MWRSINRATDSDIGECDFAILTLCFEDKIGVGCCADNEPFKNNPAFAGPQRSPKLIGYSSWISSPWQRYLTCLWQVEFEQKRAGQGARPFLALGR